MKTFFVKKRKIIILICDILLLIGTFLLVALLSDLIHRNTIVHYSIIAVLYGICYAIFCFIFKMTNSMWRYATFKEYFKLFVCLALTNGLMIPVALVFGCNLLFLILNFGVSFTTLMSIRLIYSFYLYVFKNKRQMIMDNPEFYTLIIGAGWTCNRILRDFGTKNYEYIPKCIVDDDPLKLNCTIDGVKVVGTTFEISEVCKHFNIKKILFAIPSCQQDIKTRILNDAVKTGAKVSLIPDLTSLDESANLVKQAKKVEIEDLLGREVLLFDNKIIEQSIKDKICLVTGGGGSIGSELCRQIASYKPKKLIIIDFYENNAFDIEQELIRHCGNTLDLVVEICSVTDRKKLDLVFKRFRPNIVFHAAAYKHVPLMEKTPDLAVTNNVYGTFNVAQLADENEVDKFVMISTDKAVNPTNVMGATKRCCEMIIQYMTKTARHTDYCAVRFGNVLGSNGSVVPLFRKQIAEGGPLTVTSKEMIRYFMTIKEAVSLVLEAQTFAHGGEIFVLDMGKPVRIIDMAENFIKLSGYIPYKDIDIKIIGLRPGEKLFEELLLAEEGMQKTENEKIYIGSPIEIDYDNFYKEIMELIAIAESKNMDEVLKQIKLIVPTFRTKIGVKKEDNEI